MLKMSQQFVLLLLLPSFRFLLADIFSEKLTPEENESLSDSVLAAAIDDINDDEIFREYSNKPPYRQPYPNLQDQQHFVQPPKPTQYLGNEHSSLYQVASPSNVLYNNFNQPYYHDNHGATVEVVTPDIDQDPAFNNNNKATIEVVQGSALHNQKFDSIVEYLLRKLEHEDQRIIDGIYGMLFDSNHNTRPVGSAAYEATTSAQNPKNVYDVCKEDLKKEDSEEVLTK